MRGSSIIPLALGCWIAFTSRLSAQELTKDAIEKITSHLQEARSHSMSKSYAKSNESYDKVLALLPPAKEGALEASRAKIHYDIGCNWALQGKKPEAIASLGRAVGHGYWDSDYLTQDPALKELRAEKEFQALAEKAKVGLSRMVVGLVDVLTGKKIEAKDLENKVLIIDVWGTWCPPCRREIPHFIKLKQKYAAQGLEIVGLTWERQVPSEAIRNRVTGFAKEQSMNYPLVLLEQDLYSLLSSLYGVRSFPTTYFFGRDGSLKHRFTQLQDFEVLESKALELIAKK